MDAGAKGNVDVDVGNDEIPRLIAYRVHRGPALRLVPAPRGRAWMEAITDGVAHHCLPLLMANQAGWLLLSSHAVTATWDGGSGKEAIRLDYGPGPRPYPAVSHTGHGILTWLIPYHFRTPPGWNLLVRGPANCPKPGASPLEGLVETDWAEGALTMSWQLTDPGRPVSFAAGEPFAMLVPQRRGDLEAFQPSIRGLASDAEAERAYWKWAESRRLYLEDVGRTGAEAIKHRWTKDYFRGATPDGTSVPGHQTRLRLREFDDPSGICYPDEPRGSGSG